MKEATLKQKRMIYALLAEGALSQAEDGPIYVEGLTMAMASHYIEIGQARRGQGVLGFTEALSAAQERIDESDSAEARDLVQDLPSAMAMVRTEGPPGERDWEADEKQARAVFLKAVREGLPDTEAGRAAYLIAVTAWDSAIRFVRARAGHAPA